MNFLTKVWPSTVLRSSRKQIPPILRPSRTHSWKKFSNWAAVRLSFHPDIIAFHRDMLKLFMHPPAWQSLDIPDDYTTIRADCISPMRQTLSETTWQCGSQSIIIPAINLSDIHTLTQSLGQSVINQSVFSIPVYPNVKQSARMSVG